jgi:hypothetical protein
MERQDWLSWRSTAVLAAAATSIGLVLRRLRRPSRRWPHMGVEARRSRIPQAGDGLYAARRFVAGEVLGEYYGRVLTMYQAARLENRDYLMGGFGLNAHVDARFALDCPARYVNDHFDPGRLNARFIKSRVERRAKLVATRLIFPGEEIYASYGEAYWHARGVHTGLPLRASPPNTNTPTQAVPAPRDEMLCGD